MINQELIKQVEDSARDMIHAGCTIEINYHLPYVAVTLDDDSEYFFQDSEASELLDSCPDYLNEEDYILWSAMGW